MVWLAGQLASSPIIVRQSLAQTYLKQAGKVTSWQQHPELISKKAQKENFRIAILC
jgi:hypothetical protein